MSLPPREAWIEIVRIADDGGVYGGRFPRGKRGLKFTVNEAAEIYGMSLPPREAWIEISVHSMQQKYLPGRFPRGKRGLK